MITFTNEQIEKAYASAPKAVQEAVEDGKVASTVFAISKKHTLHVDVIGKAAGMATSTLIGLLSPTQFVEELKKSGVEEKTAHEILKELNDVLFKPLFETIQKEPQGEPASSKPAVREQSPVQNTHSVSPIPLKDKTILKDVSQEKFSSPTPLQAVTPLVPASPLISEELKKPEPLLASSLPTSLPTSKPRPEVAPLHTMALDVRGMGSLAPQKNTALTAAALPLPREIPKPSFASTAPRPVLQNKQATPPPFIVPKTSPAAPALPNMSVAPQEKPSLEEKLSGMPTKEEVAASLKQYGIDPYREPVE